MSFDPTTNRIPFGLLTSEEQATLKAWPHGWEYCNGNPNDSWGLVGGKPSWLNGFVYRGKPAPKVTSYWFNIYEGYRLGGMWSSPLGARDNATAGSLTMRMDICNGEVTITKET